MLVLSVAKCVYVQHVLNLIPRINIHFKTTIKARMPAAMKL